MASSGVGPRISIMEEGDGAVRFMGRLNAISRNTSPGAFAEASAEMMKALELYTSKNWGKNVKVTESTEVRWPNWQPLYNTGALKRSLTEAGAPGAVREITPYGFKWGTSIYYAKFLQKGTRKMSPKPVIGGHQEALRGLRAVTGYAMRRYMMRGVVTL